MHTSFELSPLITSEALEGHVVTSLLVHGQLRFHLRPVCSAVVLHSITSAEY